MIINKVFDFIEANINMLGERYGHLSAHKKEQVLYRLEACKDTCMPKGKCEECGCLGFKQTLMLKKLSALVSPNGQESIVPVAAFCCEQCGHINKEFAEGAIQ